MEALKVRAAAFQEDGEKASGRWGKHDITLHYITQVELLYLERSSTEEGGNNSADKGRTSHSLILTYTFEVYSQVFIAVAAFAAAVYGKKWDTTYPTPLHPIPPRNVELCNV